MATMRRGEIRLAIAFAVAISLFAILRGRAFSADDVPAALLSAGWKEESVGLFTSLPGRVVKTGPSELAADLALARGTGVVWRKDGSWEPKGAEPFSLGMSVDNVNATSRDYDRRKAGFPLSVTLVFGKDFQDVPFKRRFLDFLAGLAYGFSPRGIRLTYAFGNHVPGGSMYRLSEEHTVFTLAGSEDAGRPVAVKISPAADFRAAYAREPKGPVTAVIIRAERPSAETGPAKASLSLAWPPARLP